MKNANSKSQTILKEIQKRHQIPKKWDPIETYKHQHRYRKLLDKKPKEYDKFDVEKLKKYDRHSPENQEKRLEKLGTKYLK